jgi:hypothetical protein
MQTNLKFNSLQFFSPSKKSTNMKWVHALFSTGAGKKNSENFYLYLDYLIESENLKWKYIRVSHDSNHIYLSEGNEMNGYFLNSNNALASRSLIEGIFDFLKIPVSYETKQKIKVKFYFQKVEEGMYLLKKI